MTSSLPAPSSPLHIVIDIETLGIDPGCEIRSIGACAFHDGRLDPLTFYRLTHNDVSFNGHVDPDTLNWWRTEPSISKLARRHCLQQINRATITRALIDFTKWIWEVDAVRHSSASNTIFWGNGPDFDQACLAVAMKACGVEIPWNYRDNRDYRTIRDAVGGVELRRRTVRHHAMHDAVHEARKIMTAIHWIKRDHGFEPFTRPSRRTRGGGTKQENT